MICRDFFFFPALDSGENLRMYLIKIEELTVSQRLSYAPNIGF